MIGSLSIALALCAQAPAPAPAPANDPRMLADYARMVEFLQKQPSYRLEVRVDWKSTGQGLDQSGTNRYRFALERPGKFRIEVRPGEAPAPSLLVVSDGEAVTTFYPAKGLYSRSPLRAPAEAMEANPIVAMSLDGSLIDTLMRPDLVEVVKDHAGGGRLVGAEAVDGRTLNRYTLRWRRDDEEIWIGPEDQPLLRRVVRTVQVPVREGETMRLVTTAELKWQLAGAIPPDTFAPDLPPDAKRVDDIYNALVQGDAPALVGQPAPAVDLRTLDGAPAKPVAHHREKDVIVLEFWATWAGPSREVAPILSKLAAAYAGKDVAVYAVNIGEPAAAVAAAQKAAPRGATVLLDPDRKAVAAFGLTSIPAVLVIDRAGVVRAVHLGTPEGLEATLRDQIEALRAGKPIEP
jgi:thiol-disulfide isomerase/thioredoxin/outer membrane lipoprotein-sorting protein